MKKQMFRKAGGGQRSKDEIVGEDEKTKGQE